MRCIAYNLVVLEIKSQNKWIILSLKNLLSKNGLSGNDHRVATLHKLYLTVVGIVMQSLKSIRQFQHVLINGKKLTVTYPYYRKASFLTIDIINPIFVQLRMKNTFDLLRFKVTFVIPIFKTDIKFQWLMSTTWL